jgi:hypothetical protein
MFEAKQQLEHALDAALAQYAETMAQAFPIVPILEVVDDPEFWAMAKIDGDIFRIQVSTGTADSTAKLWTSAFNDECFVASFGQAVGTDADAMMHISLIWLMLHEIHHFQMEHFDSQPQPNLPMASTTIEHGLVKRTAKHSGTDPSSSAASSLILEMQADHDATEMLLDAYSSDEWLSLRARVASVSAVMMLIECSDSSNHSFDATHPKAATRIFQLLGHVIDMPMTPTHLEVRQSNKGQLQPDKLPENEEHIRFAAQVVVPAFFDAVSLARVATALSIIDDLGSASDFFHDVQVAKLANDQCMEEFNTSGAMQWAKLAQRMHTKRPHVSELREAT